jgi:hypothetical protein
MVASYLKEVKALPPGRELPGEPNVCGVDFINEGFTQNGVTVYCNSVLEYLVQAI